MTALTAPRKATELARIQKCKALELGLAIDKAIKQNYTHNLI